MGRGKNGDVRRHFERSAHGDRGQQGRERAGIEERGAAGRREGVYGATAKCLSADVCCRRVVPVRIYIRNERSEEAGNGRRRAAGKGERNEDETYGGGSNSAYAMAGTERRGESRDRGA